MQILKPADLKIGDVVCFTTRDGLTVKPNRFPFGDHQVVREHDGGFTLRRPYVDHDTGEIACEDGFWKKDSNFEFGLLSRWS